MGPNVGKNGGSDSSVTSTDIDMHWIISNEKPPKKREHIANWRKQRDKKQRGKKRTTGKQR